MAFYESVFIARQDVSAIQVDSLADAFTAILKERGGNVTKRENWGLRNLAFRMRKNRKGHYVLLNIDAPWAAVQEMERNMRLNEDVIRFLTVRVDQLEESPSAMLQKRDERADRGDRFERGPPRRREAAGSGDERGPRAERGKTESRAEGAIHE
ncbi:MAG: 30S ribosomal protein S6 [Pseudomonadota bacterium]